MGTPTAFRRGVVGISLSALVLVPAACAGAVLLDVGGLSMCFPVFLILALLFAALYAQGKSPLAFFDFQTPKGRTLQKYRVRQFEFVRGQGSQKAELKRLTGRVGPIAVRFKRLAAVMRRLGFERAAAALDKTRVISIGQNKGKYIVQTKETDTTVVVQRINRKTGEVETRSFKKPVMGKDKDGNPKVIKPGGETTHGWTKSKKAYTKDEIKGIDRKTTEQMAGMVRNMKEGGKQPVAGAGEWTYMRTGRGLGLIGATGRALADNVGFRERTALRVKGGIDRIKAAPLGAWGKFRESRAKANEKAIAKTQGKILGDARAGWREWRVKRNSQAASACQSKAGALKARADTAYTMRQKDVSRVSDALISSRKVLVTQAATLYQTTSKIPVVGGLGKQYSMGFAQLGTMGSSVKNSFKASYYNFAAQKDPRWAKALSAKEFAAVGNMKVAEQGKLNALTAQRDLISGKNATVNGKVVPGGLQGLEAKQKANAGTIAANEKKLAQTKDPAEARTLRQQNDQLHKENAHINNVTGAVPTLKSMGKEAALATLKQSISGAAVTVDRLKLQEGAALDKWKHASAQTAKLGAGEKLPGMKLEFLGAWAKGTGEYWKGNYAGKLGSRWKATAWLGAVTPWEAGGKKHAQKAMNAEMTSGRALNELQQKSKTLMDEHKKVADAVPNLRDAREAARIRMEVQPDNKQARKEFKEADKDYGAALKSRSKLSNEIRKNTEWLGTPEGQSRLEKLEAKHKYDEQRLQPYKIVPLEKEIKSLEGKKNDLEAKLKDFEGKTGAKSEGYYARQIEDVKSQITTHNKKIEDHTKELDNLRASSGDRSAVVGRAIESGKAAETKRAAADSAIKEAKSTEMKMKAVRAELDEAREAAGGKLSKNEEASYGSRVAELRQQAGSLRESASILNKEADGLDNIKRSISSKIAGEDWLEGKREKWAAQAWERGILDNFTESRVEKGMKAAKSYKSAGGTAFEPIVSPVNSYIVGAWEMVGPQDPIKRMKWEQGKAERIDKMLKNVDTVSVSVNIENALGSNLRHYLDLRREQAGQEAELSGLRERTDNANKNLQSLHGRGGAVIDTDAVKMDLGRYKDGEIEKDDLMKTFNNEIEKRQNLLNAMRHDDRLEVNHKAEAMATISEQLNTLEKDAKKLEKTDDGEKFQQAAMKMEKKYESFSNIHEVQENLWNESKAKLEKELVALGNTQQYAEHKLRETTERATAMSQDYAVQDYLYFRSYMTDGLNTIAKSAARIDELENQVESGKLRDATFAAKEIAKEEAKIADANTAISIAAERLDNTSMETRKAAEAQVANQFMQGEINELKNVRDRLPYMDEKEREKAIGRMREKAEELSVSHVVEPWLDAQARAKDPELAVNDPEAAARIGAESIKKVNTYNEISGILLAPTEKKEAMAGKTGMEVMSAVFDETQLKALEGAVKADGIKNMGAFKSDLGAALSLRANGFTLEMMKKDTKTAKAAEALETAENAVNSEISSIMKKIGDYGEYAAAEKINSRYGSLKLAVGSQDIGRTRDALLGFIEDAQADWASLPSMPAAAAFKAAAEETGGERKPVAGRAIKITPVAEPVREEELPVAKPVKSTGTAPVAKAVEELPVAKAVLAELPADHYSKVGSWEALFARIDDTGPVKGKTAAYTPQEIKDVITLVRNDKLGLNVITRQGGLRDAVSNLMEADRAELAVHTKAVAEMQNEFGAFRERLGIRIGVEEDQCGQALTKLGEEHPEFVRKALADQGKFTFDDDFVRNFADDKGRLNHAKISQELQKPFMDAINGMSPKEYDALKRNVASYSSEKPDAAALAKADALIKDFVESGSFGNSAMLNAVMTAVPVVKGEDGKMVPLFTAVDEVFGSKGKGPIITILTHQEWDGLHARIWDQDPAGNMARGWASKEEFMASRRDNWAGGFGDSLELGIKEGIMLPPCVMEKGSEDVRASFHLLMFTLCHEYAHGRTYTRHGGGDASEALMVAEGTADMAAFRVVEQFMRSQGIGIGDNLTEYRRKIRCDITNDNSGEYLYGRAIVEPMMQNAAKRGMREEFVRDMTAVQGGRMRLDDLVGKYSDEGKPSGGGPQLMRDGGSPVAMLRAPTPAPKAADEKRQAVLRHVNGAVVVGILADIKQKDPTNKDAAAAMAAITSIQDYEKLDFSTIYGLYDPSVRRMMASVDFGAAFLKNAADRVRSMRMGTDFTQAGVGRKDHFAYVDFLDALPGVEKAADAKTLTGLLENRRNAETRRAEIESLGFAVGLLKNMSPTATKAEVLEKLEKMQAKEPDASKKRDIENASDYIRETGIVSEFTRYAARKDVEEHIQVGDRERGQVLANLRTLSVQVRDLIEKVPRAADAEEKVGSIALKVGSGDISRLGTLTKVQAELKAWKPGMSFSDAEIDAIQDSVARSGAQKSISSLGDALKKYADTGEKPKMIDHIRGAVKASLDEESKRISEKLGKDADKMKKAMDRALENRTIIHQADISRQLPDDLKSQAGKLLSEIDSKGKELKEEKNPTNRWRIAKDIEKLEYGLYLTVRDVEYRVLRAREASGMAHAMTLQRLYEIDRELPHLKESYDATQAVKSALAESARNVIANIDLMNVEKARLRTSTWQDALWHGPMAAAGWKEKATPGQTRNYHLARASLSFGGAAMIVAGILVPPIAIVAMPLGAAYLGARLTMFGYGRHWQKKQMYGGEYFEGMDFIGAQSMAATKRGKGRDFSRDPFRQLFQNGDFSRMIRVAAQNDASAKYGYRYGDIYVKNAYGTSLWPRDEVAPAHQRFQKYILEGIPNYITSKMMAWQGRRFLGKEGQKKEYLEPRWYSLFVHPDIVATQDIKFIKSHRLQPELHFAQDPSIFRLMGERTAATSFENWNRRALARTLERGIFGPQDPFTIARQDSPVTAVQAILYSARLADGTAIRPQVPSGPALIATGTVATPGIMKGVALYRGIGAAPDDAGARKAREAYRKHLDSITQTERDVLKYETMLVDRGLKPRYEEAQERAKESPEQLGKRLKSLTSRRQMMEEGLAKAATDAERKMYMDGLAALDAQEKAGKATPRKITREEWAAKPLKEKRADDETALIGRIATMKGMGEQMAADLERLNGLPADDEDGRENVLARMRGTSGSLETLRGQSARLIDVLAAVDRTMAKRGYEGGVERKKARLRAIAEREKVLYNAHTLLRTIPKEGLSKESLSRIRDEDVVSLNREMGSVMARNATLTGSFEEAQGKLEGLKATAGKMGQESTRLRDEKRKLLPLGSKQYELDGMMSILVYGATRDEQKELSELRSQPGTDPIGITTLENRIEDIARTVSAYADYRRRDLMWNKNMDGSRALYQPVPPLSPDEAAEYTRLGGYAKLIPAKARFDDLLLDTIAIRSMPEDREQAFAEKIGEVIGKHHRSIRKELSAATEKDISSLVDIVGGRQVLREGWEENLEKLVDINARLIELQNVEDMADTLAHGELKPGRDPKTGFLSLSAAKPYIKARNDLLPGVTVKAGGIAYTGTGLGRCKIEVPFGDDRVRVDYNDLGDVTAYTYVKQYKEATGQVTVGRNGAVTEARVSHRDKDGKITGEIVRKADMRGKTVYVGEDGKVVAEGAPALGKLKAELDRVVAELEPELKVEKIQPAQIKVDEVLPRFESAARELVFAAMDGKVGDVAGSVPVRDLLGEAVGKGEDVYYYFDARKGKGIETTHNTLVVPRADIDKEIREMRREMGEAPLLERDRIAERNSRQLESYIDSLKAGKSLCGLKGGREVTADPYVLLAALVEFTSNGADTLATRLEREGITPVPATEMECIRDFGAIKVETDAKGGFAVTERMVLSPAMHAFITGEVRMAAVAAGEKARKELMMLEEGRIGREVQRMGNDLSLVSRTDAAVQTTAYSNAQTAEARGRIDAQVEVAVGEAEKALLGDAFTLAAYMGLSEKPKGDSATLREFNAKIVDLAVADFGIARIRMEEHIGEKVEAAQGKLREMVDELNAGRDRIREIKGMQAASLPSATTVRALGGEEGGEGPGTPPAAPPGAGGAAAPARKEEEVPVAKPAGYVQPGENIPVAKAFPLTPKEKSEIAPILRKLEEVRKSIGEVPSDAKVEAFLQKEETAVQTALAELGGKAPPATPIAREITPVAEPVGKVEEGEPVPASIRPPIRITPVAEPVIEEAAGKRKDMFARIEKKDEPRVEEGRPAIKGMFARIEKKDEEPLVVKPLAPQAPEVVPKIVEDEFADFRKDTADEFAKIGKRLDVTVRMAELVNAVEDPVPLKKLEKRKIVMAEAEKRRKEIRKEAEGKPVEKAPATVAPKITAPEEKKGGDEKPPKTHAPAAPKEKPVEVKEAAVETMSAASFAELSTKAQEKFGIADTVTNSDGIGVIDGKVAIQENGTWRLLDDKEAKQFRAKFGVPNPTVMKLSEDDETSRRQTLELKAAIDASDIKYKRSRGVPEPELAKLAAERKKKLDALRAEGQLGADLEEIDKKYENAPKPKNEREEDKQDIAEMRDFVGIMDKMKAKKGGEGDEKPPEAPSAPAVLKQKVKKIKVEMKDGEVFVDGKKADYGQDKKWRVDGVEIKIPITVPGVTQPKAPEAKAKSAEDEMRPIVKKLVDSYADVKEAEQPRTRFNVEPTENGLEFTGMYDGRIGKENVRKPLQELYDALKPEEKAALGTYREKDVIPRFAKLGDTIAVNIERMEMMSELEEQNMSGKLSDAMAVLSRAIMNTEGIRKMSQLKKA